jgi:alcohol dehydrogenase
VYNAFSFSVRGEVSFGVGCLRELPTKILAKKLKRVLFMVDPCLAKARTEVEDLLAEQKIAYAVFTEIEADPSSKTVMKAVKFYLKNRCQGIVCLGGGSVMDAGKAVSLVALNGGKIEDYERPHNQCQTVPVFAIPTTAGTGSEVSRVVVVTNDEHFKMIIGGDNIVPEHALLDPQLITTMPASLAAATGADALIHAVEAYLSLTGTPFTDMVAEKAMALIGPNLRTFVARRTNMEAASAMLLGSMYAGIAQSLARPGDTHALSHALSGLFRIPHGVANAVLFPHVLAFNALADQGKYKKIYCLIKSLPAELQGFEQTLLLQEIRQLNEDLGMPKSITELGVTKEHLPELIRDTLKSTLFAINPRETTAQDVERIYCAAL